MTVPIFIEQAMGKRSLLASYGSQSDLFPHKQLWHVLLRERISSIGSIASW
jgi:hypothetical protein